MAIASDSKQTKARKGPGPSKNRSDEAGGQTWSGLKAFSLRLKQVLPYAAWVVCIGVSIFAVWRLSVVLERSSLFAIERIEQQGCKRLTLEVLCAYSGIGQGQNLLALESEAVSRRLESHSWIRRASVVKRFPRQLLLKLQEREPEAMIKIRKAMYYLDDEGVVFHRLSAGDRLDLPVITGLENYKGTLGRLGETREMRKVLSLLRVLDGRTVLGRTSEISVDALKGLVFYLEAFPVPMQIGWDHYFEKRDRLEKIFSEIMTEVKEITAVDLRFADQIVLQQDIYGERWATSRERTRARPAAISMLSAW